MRRHMRKQVRLLPPCDVRWNRSAACFRAPGFSRHSALSAPNASHLSRAIRLRVSSFTPPRMWPTYCVCFFQMPNPFLRKNARSAARTFTLCFSRFTEICRSFSCLHRTHPESCRMAVNTFSCDLLRLELRMRAPTSSRAFFRSTQRRHFRSAANCLYSCRCAPEATQRLRNATSPPQPVKHFRRSTTPKPSLRPRTQSPSTALCRCTTSYVLRHASKLLARRRERRNSANCATNFCSLALSRTRPRHFCSTVFCSPQPERW
mmetsp:Transcript_996/g.2080  ORF Transcript_996/g.2080 Transcript_996/m.2080 type:complete len:262 (-) Transcript_996:9058-9843(-)